VPACAGRRHCGGVAVRLALRWQPGRQPAATPPQRNARSFLTPRRSPAPGAGAPRVPPPRGHGIAFALRGSR
jgi:hypothetical protein